MAIRTYDILLDSYNSTIPEPIVGRQGDKNGAVTLHVTITDRGTAVDLTGQTVNLIAETANGTAVVADNAGVTLTDAVNGKFDYAIPNALWSEAGEIMKAYFSLNDTDGQQATYDLIFIVKKAVDVSQEKADDYITVIDGTLRDLKAKIDEIYVEYQNGSFYSRPEIDKLLSHYYTNVKYYGVKGDGTTDDLAAINKLIADAAPGETLFFPAGSYKVSGNIQINKRINIQGVRPIYEDGDFVRGTVIRGGGGIFLIGGASGTIVDGVGVVVATGFTNGFDIRGTLSAITIKNCLTIAQAHGYLIESYLGLVDGVTVENCEAHDSIHGFISKATRTTFSQCLAENVSSWGFGVITDNIKGATNIGIAQNNKVINCRAIKSGYAYAQYRRNYFADDASTVPCNGNQFIGCSNTNCVWGIVIGDPVGDTGNGKYTTYPVTNTTITNYVEDGGKFRANYSENLVLSGVTLKSTAEVKQDATHSNKSMVVGAQSGQPIGGYDDIRILDSSTTPDISFGHTFRSNNNAPTTITNLVGGRNGDQYTISLWDDYTTIDGLSSVGNINLKNGAFHGRGNSITFKAQSGVLFEVNRTHILVSDINVSGETSPIGIGLHPFVDIVANSSMTMKPVRISNPELHDAMLTVLIRSSNGTISPSGFDPTQFVVPDDLPMKPLNFGTGLLTQWAYLSAINKYILVSYRLAKYA